MTLLDRIAIRLVVALFVALILYGLFGPPPVEFHSSVAWPEQSTVCPGDTLHWTIGFTIHRAPAVVAIVRSWWSVDRLETLKPDDSPSWTAYLESVTVEAAERQVMVPTLPPGQYELQTGVQALRSSRADVYVVPFTVPGGCDD